MLSIGLRVICALICCLLTCVPISLVEEARIDSPVTNSILVAAGFLRRNRKKEKKNKKKDDAANEDAPEKKDVGSDGEDMRKSQTPTPEVDEEGYSKQPHAASSDPWADFNQSNFYSSSDDSGEFNPYSSRFPVQYVFACR